MEAVLYLHDHDFQDAHRDARPSCIPRLRAMHVALQERCNVRSRLGYDEVVDVEQFRDP